MKKMFYFSLIILSLGFLGLILWHFVFSIYEVKYDVPKIKLALNDSCNIDLIPINSFGKKAPFRSLTISIEAVEGNELIDLDTSNAKNGRAIVKSLRKKGVIVLKVSSKYAILPSTIKICIE